MKRKTTIAICLALVALTLGTAACGSDDDDSSAGATTTEAATTEGTTTQGEEGASGTLDGETGPGFTIDLTQDGKHAEVLPPGTYTLRVEDKSEMHNFHLIGPGVDEEVTTVPFVGEKSVTVTLEPGEYTYQCDPHANTGMKGIFEVT